MPGQSFTTMDSHAYCDTYPDACYVDFNDDGIQMPKKIRLRLLPLLR
jgi:hypothetical protein